jgi:YHS domain-containing protein
MVRFFFLLFSIFPALAFSQPEATPAIEIKENIKKPVIKKDWLKPEQSFTISTAIPEGSGLVFWNGKLWTHNDSGKPLLFAIDPITGKLQTTYVLPGVENKDWEDLSDDENYFYLGDIGNNLHIKDTLRIFRIEKRSLLEQKPKIDVITFTWPETWNRGKKGKINFDCEAMAVINDSIYLFTKEWQKGKRTRMFTLPKVPGTYIAKYHATLNTNVLVTGASYHTETKKLVLCGYNVLLRPFLLVFEEGRASDFFSGPVKKIKIRKPFRQTEGISTFDGKTYYSISEDWRFLFLHTKQQLHKLQLEK